MKRVSCSAQFKLLSVLFLDLCLKILVSPQTFGGTVVPPASNVRGAAEERQRAAAAERRRGAASRYRPCHYQHKSYSTNWLSSQAINEEQKCAPAPIYLIPLDSPRRVTLYDSLSRSPVAVALPRHVFPSRYEPASQHINHPKWSPISYNVPFSKPT